MVCLVCFTDKAHTAPRLSLINVQALNYLLRSEIYVSEDRQLRSIPLILGYTPKPADVQPAGNAIIQGDYRLQRIDVARKAFLAPYDLPPVPHPNPQGVPLLVRPVQQVPPAQPAVRERVGSSSTSLDEQIDKFKFEGESEGGVHVIPSDSEEEADRQSFV